VLGNGIEGPVLGLGSPKEKELALRHRVSGK